MPFQKGHKLGIGRKYSKETLLKMSLSHKAIKGVSEFKKGHKPFGGAVKGRLKGRVMSLEWRKKIADSMRGSKSHHWRGGVSFLGIIIRGCYRYRQWRSDVFTRDKFLCIQCGYSKGGIIEADHIIPFATILKNHGINSIETALTCEELWDINNGRTLCNPCHRKTETFGKPNLK